jgi:transposase
MKTINLHSQYSKRGGYIQLCLPIETETFIPTSDSVRLLDQVFETFNYQDLYRTYQLAGRNPVVSPKTLCKILVYAYSRGIYSSRAIERSCHLDLAFRFLLQGEKAPDHNTIARFRRKHLGPFAENLLTQFVQYVASHQELSFQTLFVDGTKWEANANKYTFVWRGSTSKWEAKLQKNAHTFLANKIPNLPLPEHLSASFLAEILSMWQGIGEAQQIVFVHGKGKHKPALQREIEQLEDYVQRQARYEQIYEILGEHRNSYSKTDPDATFMHLKEDHMRNGQLKAAYNVQIGVESEYIVGIDISQQRNDQYTLIPFLERLRLLYSRNFVELVADAGYESEANYHYLEEQGIKAYIKPSNYAYSKTRKYQRDMELRLAMTYSPEEDAYTCKAGRKLIYKKMRCSKNKETGFVSTGKVYECQNCSGCTHLGTCYKGKYKKQITINERFDAYRANSLEHITSQRGTLLRMNRSIQAEGVFGILKQDLAFQRFLLRGKANVRTEMLLLALGFDINKLFQRIYHGRTGQALFPLKNIA